MDLEEKMRKLLTTAIALGAIFTFEMNQPVLAHGGGHGGGHGGFHGGGHYAGGGHYHGGYHHGYHHGGWGDDWGYGVGAFGVGVGLGVLGATVYDTVPASCYDSFGNYICYSY